MRGADSVERSWERIDNWLRANAPATVRALRPPADPAAIAAAEATIGASLPEDVVASLRIHDGNDEWARQQFDFPSGYTLISADRIAHAWRSLRDLFAGTEDDMSFWWRSEWPPVAEHITGDALVTDLVPGPERGRIGEFMPENGMSFGYAPSFAALLQRTADLLEGVLTDNENVPVGRTGGLEWSWREPVDPAARWPSDVIAAAVIAAAPPGPARPQATTIGRLTSRAYSSPLPGSGADYRVPRTPEPPRQWPAGWGRSCLTFARDLTEPELIARFGGNAESITELTADEATRRQTSWRHAYRPLIRVGRIDGWVFAVEQEHEYGVAVETLRRLSIGTDAVSVASDGTLAHAHDGTVSIERLDDVGNAVALAIRRGPGRFDPAALAGTLPGATLLPLLPEPDAQPRRTPVANDPDLVPIIEHATEAQLRPVVIALARKRMERLGLSDQTDIGAALTAAADGPTGMPEQDSPVGVALRRLVSEATAAMPGWQESDGRAAPVSLTDIERTTWRIRAQWAADVTTILARPAIVAAHSMIDAGGGVLEERAELLAALADVAPPADAVEQLTRAEEERGHPAMP